MAINPKEFGEKLNSYGQYDASIMPQKVRNKSHNYSNNGHLKNPSGLESQITVNGTHVSQTPSHGSLDNPEDFNNQ